MIAAIIKKKNKRNTVIHVKVILVLREKTSETDTKTRVSKEGCTKR